MKNKRKIIVLSLFILVTLFVYRLYVDNFTFKVTTYEINNISFDSLKGTTIVQVSDLHNTKYGENNIKLIEEIDNINPNYVFLTGDMVNAEDDDFDGFYSLIEGICDKYTCFYVVGNHELGLGIKKYYEIMKYLNKHNVKVLDNEYFALTDDVYVYGLNYDDEFYLNSKYTLNDMRNDLGNANNNIYNILLAHNPCDFDTYSEWGANLVFSGHTHGGMIRLFDVGLVSPNRNLFPMYDGGEYEINSSKMINSRGMSKGHIGFRLFNQPELVVVKF